MPSLRILLAASALCVTACSSIPPPAPQTAPVAASPWQAPYPGGHATEGRVAQASRGAQDLREPIMQCYQDALLFEPTTEGELRFSLSLAQNGSVIDTRVDHTGTCGKVFLLCVQNALQGLQFEPGAGGELATIEGKLTFARRDE